MSPEGNVRTAALLLATVGCGAVAPKAPANPNLCPVIIKMQIDTATSVSSWGGSDAFAMAGLNRSAAECIATRADRGKASGSITGYRLPVTVWVRSAIVDAARYKKTVAFGGLEAYVRLDAVSPNGVVLESDSTRYGFIETDSSSPVSGALLLTAEEMRRLDFVRVSWVFTR